MSIFVVTALIVSSCGNMNPATSFEEEEEPELPASQLQQPDEQRPTPTPFDPVRIYELVLSSGVNSDGEPLDDRASIPVGASLAYLMVRTQNVRQGTEFEAEWRQDGETIGWSNYRARETTRGDKWIALEFRPPGGGFTSGDYSVHLRVDGRRIESLAFIGGSGRVGQPTAIPRLVFTSSWSLDQTAISTQSVFEHGTSSVVAVLANPPSSGSFVSRWYRDDELLSEIPAESAQSPTVRAFRFEPGEPLVPGQYRVATFAGNQHVATATFSVQPPPDAVTPAQFIELTVVRQFDEARADPIGEPVSEVTTPLELHAMVLVQDVGTGDVVGVRWSRNGELVFDQQITDQAIARGWIVFTYEIPAEPEAPGSEYRVEVLLNDDPVLDHQFIALPGQ